ncbi:MAG: L-seryl-tRNA(Sec) selenium transferase, partial [Caldilineaceae bacterium]|nr:L-seryl-tRNA(Sec) selenium transferase [Caldilineaceae bacterium]
MREMITQPADRQSEYRKLPAVDVLLRLPAVALLAAEYGDAAVTTGVRAVLAAARTAIAAGDPAPAAEAWAALVQTHLAAADVPSLRPVIN